VSAASADVAVALIAQPCEHFDWPGSTSDPGQFFAFFRQSFDTTCMSHLADGERVCFQTQSDNPGHAGWTRFPAARKIRALGAGSEAIGEMCVLTR
jgi:hypothetical protein